LWLRGSTSGVLLLLLGWWLRHPLLLLLLLHHIVVTHHTWDLVLLLLMVSLHRSTTSSNTSHGWVRLLPIALRVPVLCNSANTPRVLYLIVRGNPHEHDFLSEISQFSLFGLAFDLGLRQLFLHPTQDLSVCLKLCDCSVCLEFVVLRRICQPINVFFELAIILSKSICFLLGSGGQLLIQVEFPLFLSRLFLKHLKQALT
jgi:hypothetical protein